MAYDIGPKIGIDGESEFRKQLQSINQGLKTLGSEAKLVAAQFDGQEGSMEALGAQTDMLNRQLHSLRERLELQEQMLQKSANAFGEADSRTQKWQQTVNATKAEIAKLQAQIERNNAAMEVSTDATGLLTTEIERQEEELAQLQRAYSNTVLEQGKNSEQAQDLSGRIRDLSGAMEENRARLAEAGNAMGGAGDEASGLASILGGDGLSVLTATVSAAGALKALWDGLQAGVSFLEDAVTSSAAFADEILTLSAQSGLGTDALQELYYMADLVDVPVSTLQGSLAKLTKTMDNYRSGNAAATEAFGKLGLAMDTVVGPDGQLRNAEDVWYVVIDALGQIQNQSERDAIAMAIFGRSAQDLNPIINQGSAGLQAYAQEARNMGAVLTDDQLAALGDVDDAFVRLNQQMDIIQRQIAVELAPVVVELAQEFLELVQSVDWESFGQMLAEELRNIADGVLTLTSALQEAVAWWNQLTGSSGKHYSSAQRIADMWDGGVTAAAAKISTPNYTSGIYSASSQAHTDAINRLASAQSQPINVNIKYTGSMAQMGRIMEPVVTVEQARQGPSLTGR